MMRVNSNDHAQKKAQKALNGLGMVAQLTDIADRLNSLGEAGLADDILQCRDALADRIQEWCAVEEELTEPLLESLIDLKEWKMKNR